MKTFLKRRCSETLVNNPLIDFCSCAGSKCSLPCNSHFSGCLERLRFINCPLLKTNHNPRELSASNHIHALDRFGSSGNNLLCLWSLCPTTLHPVSPSSLTETGTSSFKLWYGLQWKMPTGIIQTIGHVPKKCSLKRSRVVFLIFLFCWLHRNQSGISDRWSL